MNKLWKVTTHEFKSNTKTKSFVIITILGPFILFAIALLPSLLVTQGGIKDVSIAFIGGDEDFIQQVTTPLSQARVEVVVAGQSRAELDELVLDGELYGYVVLPDDLLTAATIEFVAKDITDFKVHETLQAIVGQLIVTRRIEEEGFESDRIRRLATPPRIEAAKISRKGETVEKERQDFMSVMMTGITFTILLYMTILIYGQVIGRSVLNEKLSKTVEIMLSSVNPLELLFGKILGHAGASLLQYTVWIGMGFFFIRTIGPAVGLTSLPAIPGALLAYLVVFFLLGFFLYASIYAALGAAAEDETNMSQLAWPVIMFLVIPMVTVSSIITNPNSSFAIFLSLFPMSAPIVTFLRIVVSTPKAWQIVAAIAILVATVSLTVMLSAKVFRIGILMTGKRFTLKDIGQWIRA